MIKNGLLYIEALDFLVELGAEKSNAESAIDKTTRLRTSDQSYAVIVETGKSYSTVRNVSTKDDFFHKFEVAYNEERKLSRSQAYVELLRLKVYTLDATEVLNKAFQQGTGEVSSSDNKKFLVRMRIKSGVQEFTIEEVTAKMYSKTASSLTMKHYISRMGIPAADKICEIMQFSDQHIVAQAKLDRPKIVSCINDIERAGVALKVNWQDCVFTYRNRSFSLKTDRDGMYVIEYKESDFPDVDKDKPFLIKVEEMDDKLMYQYSINTRDDVNTIYYWARVSSYVRDIMNTLCFLDDVPRDVTSWLLYGDKNMIVTQNTRYFNRRDGLTLEYHPQSKVLTVTVPKIRVTELC